MHKAGTDVHKTLTPPLKSVPDNLMVGFNNEMETIKNRLARGSSNLDIVSIVGMGGIGKTTLARKLYEDLHYHFHIRGWCCASQSYNKTELLVDILHQITQLPTEIETEITIPGETENKTDLLVLRKKEVKRFQDLGEMMYRSLKGNRYLIVIDDVWSIDVWNELGSFFPDDHNGSRIMFTSRLHNVVLQAKSDSPPHSLPLLLEEESWQLFEKKAFHGEGCPSELLDVAKEIARRCQGLPLSIVVLAGLFGTDRKNQDGWKQIAQKISIDAQEQCFHILELSYMHLPQYLKSCFLYFGAFPEDAEIPVTRMICLWIAEGFIPELEQKCLEDLAEDYLMDLTGRSLVMISARRSKGGIKTCHLHDLVREFCLEKAKEEQFLQQIRRCNELYTSGSSNAGCQSSQLSSPRLCIFDKYVDLSVWRPSNPSTRSLLFSFVKNTWEVYYFESSYISGLKDLTVLNLSGVSVTQSFFSLELPVRLRYLLVCGEIYYVPPSISVLSNLETFIVRGSYYITIGIPESIWNIVTLRHLHVKECASFKLSDHILGNISILGNLVTLSTVWCCYDKTAVRMLRALPRLQKLKCKFPEKSQFWPYSELDFGRPAASRLYHIPNLDFLTQLESLNLVYCDHIGERWISHSDFDLPLGLKKLTLSGFHLSENQILTISRLPSLEVLKILSGKFHQEDWKVKESFWKLKFLKIRELNIREWDASSDHFPCLEQLVIENCWNLLSIPLSFAEINTLLSISVPWGDNPVSNSAKQIQEEQKDLGNEELKVHFN